MAGRAVIDRPVFLFSDREGFDNRQWSERDARTTGRVWVLGGLGEQIDRWSDGNGGATLCDPQNQETEPL